MTRVVLADDHALVRAGFRSLLEGMQGIEVVGEAANGRDAIRLVEELRPDIAIVDVMMPELNGLDATARIVARCPEVKVLILSMNDGREYVLQALRSGARGYLLKTVTPLELQEAIKRLMAGEVYLSSAVTKHVVSGLLQPTNISEDGLTRRQREVLQLIAEGCSTKEIASTLNISIKTAEGHRTQLMNSLDIHDIAGLVRYAIRNGLISVED
jgi:DNA-binding NarL/FixJ family response regulator